MIGKPQKRDGWSIWLGQLDQPPVMCDPLGEPQVFFDELEDGLAGGCLDFFPAYSTKITISDFSIGDSPLALNGPAALRSTFWEHIPAHRFFDSADAPAPPAPVLPALVGAVVTEHVPAAKVLSAEIHKPISVGFWHEDSHGEES